MKRGVELSKPAERIAESGFTVVELLVSLVVISGIMAASGLALNQVSTIWSRFVARVQKHEMAHRGLDVLRRDLRLLHLPDKSAQSAINASASRLEFLSRALSSHEPAGFVKLTYRIVPTSSGFQLLRTSIGTRRNGAPIRDQVARTDVVIETEKALSFSYRGSASEGWTRAWQAPLVLPRLVRLSVLESGSGGVDAVVAIPPVGNPSCAKSLFGDCILSLPSPLSATDKLAEAAR